MAKINKIGNVYRMFKVYLRFLHDRIYYKKTYSINCEMIPTDGTPLLIVSNHQNCLNDPLGILFSFRDRKPYFITRADVFTVSPVIDKFLRSIGLLPAFRLDYEGEGALGNNAATFKISEKALIDGNTVVMFPEAGHQNKRWLGNFSLGYAKMAFEAAEMSDFKKDVIILPACNHYSDYFGMRNRFMVKYGNPISLQPYYELYKKKPRTAQREVNKLVREQISGLMLDIRDLENYPAIDFIRLTYGEDYARQQGVDPEDLPNRLITDKALVAALDIAKTADEECVNGLYADVLTLKLGLERLGITYSQLRNRVHPLVLVFRWLMLWALFPLWVFSLWPSLLIYLIPMGIFKAKMKDVMFQGTLLFGTTALITLPLLSLITLLVIGFQINWIIALVYVALFPILMLFCWWYAVSVKHTFQDFLCMMKRTSIEKLKMSEKNLHDRLNSIILKYRK